VSVEIRVPRGVLGRYARDSTWGVLLLLLVTSVDGCGNRTETVRHEIQAQIDKNLSARAARDSATFWSIFTDDYRYRAYDGEMVTRNEAARGFLASLESEIPGSTRTRITIDSLFVVEDTAMVYTRQHYARTQLAADSTSHELVTNVGHREHWVRTPEGWKVLYLEEVAEGPFTLDGQSIHVDSAGRRFTRGYWEGGVDSLRAAYGRFRAMRPGVTPFEEGTLNDLGYRLLQLGRVPDALGVFELNAEAYPMSSNVYDSLGEAYLMAGDRVSAVRNYRRSLELNPESQNAIRMLEQLGHL
jgi:tetratricopeptide (TPR) repeat protein